MRVSVISVLPDIDRDTLTETRPSAGCWCLPGGLAPCILLAFTLPADVLLGWLLRVREPLEHRQHSPAPARRPMRVASAAPAGFVRLGDRHSRRARRAPDRRRPRGVGRGAHRDRCDAFSPTAVPDAVSSSAARPACGSAEPVAVPEEAGGRGVARARSGWSSCRAIDLPPFPPFATSCG